MLSDLKNAGSFRCFVTIFFLITFSSLGYAENENDIVNNAKLVLSIEELLDSNNELILQRMTRNSENIDDLQNKIVDLETKNKNILVELENKQSKYTDVVLISLASVTVIVTVLGVIVAVLAYFGYKNTVQAAKNKAEEVAFIAASDQVKSAIKANSFDQLIIDQVERVALHGIGSPEYDEKDEA